MANTGNGNKGEKCYKVRQHLVVPGAGHVYPDTEENRKAGVRTTCKMTPEAAKRFGADLISNKQLTDADMTTK